MLMAFRSQRYHLSRGRTKKKYSRCEGRGCPGDGAKKRAAHAAVCTVVGAAAHTGIGMYFTLGLGRSSRVARAKCTRHIAHPEDFVERVWNKIKPATRRKSPLSLSLVYHGASFRRSSLLMKWNNFVLSVRWNINCFPSGRLISSYFSSRNTAILTYVLFCRH